MAAIMATQNKNWENNSVAMEAWAATTDGRPRAFTKAPSCRNKPPSTMRNSTTNCDSIADSRNRKNATYTAMAKAIPTGSTSVTYWAPITFSRPQNPRSLTERATAESTAAATRNT